MQTVKKLSSLTNNFVSVGCLKVIRSFSWLNIIQKLKTCGNYVIYKGQPERLVINPRCHSPHITSLQSFAVKTDPEYKTGKPEDTL